MSLMNHFRPEGLELGGGGKGGGRRIEDGEKKDGRWKMDDGGWKGEYFEIYIYFILKKKKGQGKCPSYKI